MLATSVRVIAVLVGLSVGGVGLAQSAVTFTGEPVRTVTAGGRSVSVFPGAQVVLEGESAREVFLTGAGVRQKRVIVNVPVYIATSYLESEEGISRSDPLGSVAANATKVLQITLVRALSGDEVRGAFSESLRENGLDPEEPGMARIFAALPETIAAGDVITIVGYDLAGDEEAVRMEIGGNAVTSTGPDLAQRLWTIWFGVPSDAGLEALKTSLIGGN